MRIEGPTALIVPVTVHLSDDGAATSSSSSIFEALLIAEHCSEVLLYCFVSHRVAGRDDVHIGRNVRIISIGDVRGGASMYAQLPRVIWRLLASGCRESWRQAVIVESGAVSLCAFAACAILRKRCIALVRGDSVETVGMAYRYRSGLGRLLPPVLRSVYRVTQFAMSRTIPVVLDHPGTWDRLSTPRADLSLIPAPSIKKEVIASSRPVWEGPSQRPLRVLWVGRLERVKAVEDLLMAMQRLLMSGRRAELTIVGTGDESYERSLRSMAAECAVDGSVEFRGALPHGPELFREYVRADVFALCSLSEGVPKVIPEALACGLPVVSTAVGGVPGLLLPSTGIMVPPRNPTALGDALGSLHDRPGAVERMSLAALQDAARFTAEEVVPQILAVVERARYPRLRDLRRPKGDGIQ